MSNRWNESNENLSKKKANKDEEAYDDDRQNKWKKSESKNEQAEVESRVKKKEAVAATATTSNEIAQQIKLPYCLNCLSPNNACTVCALMEKKEKKNASERTRIGYGNVSLFRYIRFIHFTFFYIYGYEFIFAFYYGIFTEFIDLEVSSVNLFLFSYILSFFLFAHSFAPCFLSLSFLFVFLLRMYNEKKTESDTAQEKKQKQSKAMKTQKKQMV